VWLIYPLFFYSTGIQSAEWAKKKPTEIMDLTDSTDSEDSDDEKSAG